MPNARAPRPEPAADETTTPEVSEASTPETDSGPIWVEYVSPVVGRPAVGDREQLDRDTAEGLIRTGLAVEVDAPAQE